MQTVLLNQDTKHSIQHLLEYIMDEYVRLSALYDPTLLKNNGIVDYVILFKKETLKTTEQRLDLFNHYLDENLFTNQFLNTLYKMKNSILIHDVFLILYINRFISIL